jgi:hypothetical protein
MEGEYVLTILSNLVFLIPAVEYYRHYRWTRGTIMLCVMVFSSMYHTCNSFEGGCVFDANYHRQLDYFFAQFTIPVVAIYLIYFPKGWLWLERIFLIAFAITIAILQHQIGEVLQNQLIICACAFGFILVYWVLFMGWNWKKTSTFDLPPYDWEELGPAIMFLSLASSLFVIEAQSHGIRWSIHSVWHALGAMANYYVARIRPAADRYANMDQLIREGAVKQWAEEQLLLQHLTPKSRI